MRYKGKIKELNHIVISDPSYKKDVWCRYERENLKEKNWFVDIDIKQVVEKVEDFTMKGTEFFLLLTKDRRVSKLTENGTIRYLKGIDFKEFEIGMDTACVALGIDAKADEIIELREEWQPECSLNTLTDGFFGKVKEGCFQNHTFCIWLSGYLDEDTGYTIEDIVDYLKEQLNITELEKDISIKEEKETENNMDIDI